MIGGRRVTGHFEKVRAGEAGRRIVEEARDIRARAIVMHPARRRPGGTLFGRTLDAVLEERPCRVIIEYSGGAKPRARPPDAGRNAALRSAGRSASVPGRRSKIPRRGTGLPPLDPRARGPALRSRPDARRGHARARRRAARAWRRGGRCARRDRRGPGVPRGLGAPRRIDVRRQFGRDWGGARLRERSAGRLEERVVGGLGAPGLIALGLTAIGASVYFALGVIIGAALGLTPVVLLVAGLFFVFAVMTYLEGDSLHPGARGRVDLRALRARRALELHRGLGDPPRLPDRHGDRGPVGVALPNGLLGRRRRPGDRGRHRGRRDRRGRGGQHPWHRGPRAQAGACAWGSSTWCCRL